MPALSIIPARAVADPALTDTQVRVLCAIGTYTNRLGGNVWASIPTLAKACHLNPRTIQRALPVLLEQGYLRVFPRPGRTNLYEVALESPLTPESGGGDSGVTPPTALESPKRYKERSHLTITEQDDFRRGMETIWHTYPKRPEAYSYVAMRKAIAEQVQAGASIGALTLAAQRYAQMVERDATDPKYVKSPVRFYGEGLWAQYTEATVFGRTREEWARSGQDVSEFDRLAQEGAA